MNKRLLAAACMALLLSACAGAPERAASTAPPWNSGVWNSVMGYHGPANAMGSADGPN